MKLLICGAYQQGNYGDDLMAYIFAREFAALGHETKIYGLDPEEAESLHVTAQSNLKELVAWADAVIYGGGAVMKSTPVLHALLKEETRRIETMFFNLHRQIQQSQTPLIFLSIGSDGAKKPSDLLLPRQMLLSDDVIKGATVRRQSDIALSNALGIDTSFFPDIVLYTSHIFSELQNNRVPNFENPRILFNVKKNLRDLTGEIVRALCERWPDAEIFFSNTHLDYGRFNYELKPDGVDATWRPYKGVKDFTEFLSGIDIVFSSKLHCGIAAMSFGSTFYSVAGREKVRGQFAEWGLDSEYIIPHAATGEELKSIVAKMAPYPAQTTAHLNTLKSKASGHIESGNKILSTLSPK